MDQNELQEIQQAYQSIQEQTKSLPIARHKGDILRRIDKHRVVIVSGDTGCGKTTQVPKYILEKADNEKQECRIICTQPRRIAAINISRRVAAELGERVGQRVGYHVGMQSRRTKGVTKITFMTTGIFLQRLVNNPDSIKKYTHIIMDEVHERDLDIDFSLVVIKHLLVKEQEGFNFKLILMSATFNIELFSNYFSKSSYKEIEQSMVYVGAEEKIRLEKEERERKLAEVWGPCKSDKDWSKDLSVDQSMKEVYGDEEWVDNTALALKNKLPIERRNDPAPVVEINARMFPVEELYIDSLVENLLKESKIEKTQQDRDLLYESRQVSEGNKPQVKEATMRVAAMIICDVITKLNRFDEKPEDDKNSVLVFLPGLHEIFEFIEFIRETYDDKWVRETFDLIPLHSSLCEDEQERAFRPTNRLEGRRKVIVATNIAESSITIPDVKYVIDFMLTKELNYDPTTKSESLNLSWVSKASAKQRAGRAGRVSNGFVFRLCPKRFYDNSIVEYPKPEMQRCPLEKLILQIKLWNKYEPEEILGRAIQPPDYRDIWNAIKNLQQTGALTMPPHHATEEEKKKSKITALGKIFVNLPCDLKITRLFLFGMALKCMQQAIIMGCIHQQSRSIFRTVRGGLIDQVNLTKLQCNYDNNRDSDSIMLLRIFQEWIHKFHPHLKHKAPTEERNITGPQGGFQGGYQSGAAMMQPGGGNPMIGYGGYGGMQPGRDAGSSYGQYKPQFNSGRADIQQRRVRFSRPSFAERQWCRDRNLDLNILKEVAQMVEEIRLRFQRMNISDRCLNSKVKMRDDNPESILILKTCIGGAFFNKYAKAAYKNDGMLFKMHQSGVFIGEESKRSIILNKVSDHITDGHLKQFFETKFRVPVDQVKIAQDKPTIIFGPEILDRGYIKACFKLGLRTRQSRYRKQQDEEYDEANKFQSRVFSKQTSVNQCSVFSYDEVRDQLENEELRRPCYLYELRYETINKESYVEFDRDSINAFTYELEERMLPHVTYACQDYYDKGGRFICRNSTRLPAIPMVDALFCLLFAPKVAVRADRRQQYFSQLVCDDGETIIKLTHILTHQDLQLAQKIRKMMNESLCDDDEQRMAHLGQIDFFIKRFFSFNRLPVDVFEKLLALRQDDGDTFVDDVLQQANTQKNIKAGEEESKLPTGEENFFLQDGAAASLKEGEGYDEIDAPQVISATGEQALKEEDEDGGNDAQEFEDLLKDPAKREQLMDEMFNQNTLSQAELNARQLRYERDCEKGYFLQPIQVQKLKKKIYFYDELVRQMEKEFKARIKNKRETITKMRLRMKEQALTEATLICERCSQDIAPIRTLDYISNDLHQAKCVFGSLSRVELIAAQKDPIYAEDKDFVELYIEDYDTLRAEIQQKCPQLRVDPSQPQPPRDFAFASCRNNHILGVVIDKRSYITSVSQVQILFPGSHYEGWEERWWHPGYTKVFEMQKMALAKRQLACGYSQHQRHHYTKQQSLPVRDSAAARISCELCRIECSGPEDFVVHCKTNLHHLYLEKKFQSTQFDYLFASDICPPEEVVSGSAASRLIR